MKIPDIRKNAFTLIELLVVISIIALLMTLLMPAMGGIRRAGRAVQCNSAMRQIGIIWLSFARDNEGRGPGRANINMGSNAARDFCWSDILNHYIGQGVDVFPAGFSQPIQRWHYDIDQDPFIIQPGKNRLVCPELKLTADGVGAGGGWGRAWVANANAVGGPNWINPAGAGSGGGSPGSWRGDRGPGLYGKIVEHPYFVPFSLGSPMGLFRKPSRAFLILEARRGHDDTNQRGGSEYNRPADATEAQPWGGNSAFRHPGLTAIYLMVDGHTERLSSTDPSLTANDRFAPF